MVWGHDNFPKEHFEVCWKIEENAEIVTISIKALEDLEFPGGRLAGYCEYED